MAKRQDLSQQLRFVSSRVACEVLGVTSQTLRRWAKTGRLPAIKTPGGHFRYNLAGLIIVPDAPPQPKPKKTKPAAQVDIEDIIAATPPPQVLPGVQMAFAVDPIMPRPPGVDLRAQIERLSSSSRW
jgi:excisionase family DNA binding protein